MNKSEGRAGILGATSCTGAELVMLFARRIADFDFNAAAETLADLKNNTGDLS